MKNKKANKKIMKNLQKQKKKKEQKQKKKKKQKQKKKQEKKKKNLKKILKKDILTAKLVIPLLKKENRTSENFLLIHKKIKSLWKINTSLLIVPTREPGLEIDPETKTNYIILDKPDLLAYLHELRHVLQMKPDLEPVKPEKPGYPSGKKSGKKFERKNPEEDAWLWATYILSLAKILSSIFPSSSSNGKHS